MNRSLLAIACLAALVLPRVALAQNDQIFGRTGTPTRGLITKISPTQVTMQSTGVSREFDTKDIQRLSFGDEPAELRNIRERVSAGQFEDALEALKSIDAAAIENPNIRAEVGYYVAYSQAQLALASGGDRAAAIMQLMNFIRENPETYRYFEGVELLGDLHFSQRRIRPGRQILWADRLESTLARVPDALGGLAGASARRSRQA
jgi:hypothetical protein